MGERSGACPADTAGGRCRRHHEDRATDGGPAAECRRVCGTARRPRRYHVDPVTDGPAPDERCSAT